MKFESTRYGVGTRATTSGLNSALSLLTNPPHSYCALFLFFSGGASVRNHGSYRGDSGWSRAPLSAGNPFGENCGKPSS